MGVEDKRRICMAMSFLMNAPQQIKSMELLFSVRRHSFLPCDCLFERTEKELKTRDSILEPASFHEVFSHYCSSVFKYGIDWKVSDWKAETSKLYIYMPLEKICIDLIRSCGKVTEPMGIAVHCEANNRYDRTVPANLLKRGQRHCNLKLVPVLAEKPVSAAKINDFHN